MSNLDKSALACIEIGSIGIGYACLAEIATAEIDLIEASVVGGARFMMLLGGLPENLADAVHRAQKRFQQRSAAGLTTDWETETLDTEPTGLLDAMYSLAEQKLDESLIVCETSSMSGMLLAATLFLARANVRAIEIKPLRGAAAGAYGFFTGPANECGLTAETVRTRLQASGRSARLEVIDSPPVRFREYFNISGVV